MPYFGQQVMGVQQQKPPSQEGIGFKNIDASMGMKLPDIQTEKEDFFEDDDEEQRKIVLKYPLIPKNPKKGDKILAYAHIFYDQMFRANFYYISYNH